jgi:hypothetical protein
VTQIPPCGCCGVLTRVEFMEDVSDRVLVLQKRERLACPACVERIDEDEREEALAESWNLTHPHFGDEVTR